MEGDVDMKNIVVFDRKFRELGANYKGGIFNYYLSTLVEISVQNFIPLLEACLVDEVLYHKNMISFSYIALIYMIIYLGYSLNFVLTLCIQQNTDNTFVMNIKRKIFETVIRSKADKLSNISSGDNISLVCKDADEFFLLIRKNIIRCSNEVILFLTACTFVFLMNWIIGLIMIIIVPISVILTKRFGKKAEKIAFIIRDKYGYHISWLFEMLEGMKEIRLLNASKNVKKIFQSQNEQILYNERKQNMNTVESRILINVVQFMGDMILYLASFYLIVQGRITIGCFIAFISYFNAGKLSISNIMDYLVEYKQREVSVCRVLNRLNDSQESYNMDNCADYKQKLIFKDVEFSYPGYDKKVLHKISFKVDCGEKVAIVGKSGCGKTTLIKLLINLYEPTSGEILIGNDSISNVGLQNLRKNIGVVRQEIIVFPGTIRDNLCMDSKEIPEKEIIEACKRTRLWKLIEEMPDGLDTVLDEKISDLSGGQKQRLAIARVLLRNPDIIVLDEATSAIDNETETLIQKELNEFAKQNKKIIVIAHRLNSVMNCDKVVVLDEGEVSDIGTVDIIMKKSKEFIELFSSQMNGGEKK